MWPTDRKPTLLTSTPADIQSSMLPIRPRLVFVEAAFFSTRCNLEHAPMYGSPCNFAMRVLEFLHFRCMTVAAACHSSMRFCSGPHRLRPFVRSRSFETFRLSLGVYRLPLKQHCLDNCSLSVIAYFLRLVWHEIVERAGQGSSTLSFSLHLSPDNLDHNRLPMHSAIYIS